MLPIPRRSRCESDTQRLRARLDASREPVRPRTVDFRELEGLPAPVGRYFRAVLEDGQPMVSGARAAHGHLQHGRGGPGQFEALYLGPSGGHP
jgi:hypothetical protein